MSLLRCEMKNRKGEKVGKKEFGENRQLHKRQEEEWRYLAAMIWGRRGKIHRKAVSLKKGCERKTQGGGVGGQTILLEVKEDSPTSLKSKILAGTN